MEHTLTTPETSQLYAGGAMHALQPTSIFEAVPDLRVYRAGWQQRCMRYQLLRSYYDGTVYRDPHLVKLLKLYSGIRQIFGPLRRAVRVDVARVPGGWTLPEDAPQNLVAAIHQVRAWSSWRSSYSRAVLHGAVAGEFGLLVIDDQLQRQVKIVPLRPDEVVTGQLQSGDPFGLIIKGNLVDRQGRYEYAQLITPEAIRLYRSGQLQEVRPNLHGLVPLLLAPYMAGESGIGECAFAGVYELLDRVNDATSQALDVVQRNAEPLLIVSGVDGVEADSTSNLIALPQAEAKAYTLAPNLAIDQTLALIETVLKEFKNLLPQLIFDSLLSRNDLAYDTVLTLMAELIDHIQDVRSQVDPALEQAERWALQLAQSMHLFPGVDASRHVLDADRPVIAPTPQQALALEAQHIGLESARRLAQAPQEALIAPPAQAAADAPQE